MEEFVGLVDSCVQNVGDDRNELKFRKLAAAASEIVLNFDISVLGGVNRYFVERNIGEVKRIDIVRFNGEGAADLAVEAKFFSSKDWGKNVDVSSHIRRNIGKALGDLCEIQDCEQKALLVWIMLTHGSVPKCEIKHCRGVVRAQDLDYNKSKIADGNCGNIDLHKEKIVDLLGEFGVHDHHDVASVSREFPFVRGNNECRFAATFSAIVFPLQEEFCRTFSAVGSGGRNPAQSGKLDKLT